MLLQLCWFHFYLYFFQSSCKAAIFSVNSLNYRIREIEWSAIEMRTTLVIT